MRVWNLFVGAVMALAVAGCVTTDVRPPADVQSLKLAEVRVTVPPHAQLIGYDGVSEYATAKRIPNYELNDATETEEAKAWMRDHLLKRVKASMEQNLPGALNGQRPVRAEIVVRKFMLSSAVQRIIVGGDYHMIADISLVDAKTGAVVVDYPGMVYSIPALNGWGGAIVQAAYDATNAPGDRLVKGLTEKYRDWLRKT